MNLFTFALLSAGGVVCAETSAPLLVDGDWLANHLSDKNVVILHIGPKDVFAKSHIPNARYTSLEDWSLPMRHNDPKEIMLELPPADDLRPKLTAMGIGDGTHVIVYYATKQDFPSATRVILTLDYLGLAAHSSLLNGGLPAWIAAKRADSSNPAPTAPASSKLTTLPTKPVVVDAAFVKSLPRPNHILIDARAPVFYKGIEATYGKQGHIPGAVNLPFTDILDDSALVNRDRIEKLFTAAGVKASDTVVAYCHVGQQGTAIVFAARLLGHPVVLYDGSFEDWSKNSRGAVEK